MIPGFDLVQQRNASELILGFFQAADCFLQQRAVTNTSLTGDQLNTAFVVALLIGPEQLLTNQASKSTQNPPGKHVSPKQDAKNCDGRKRGSLH